MSSFKCKTSPRISTTVQFIFHFWSFEISEHILRNQNLIISLDSYCRQRFTHLDPILIYINLWIDCLSEIHKIATGFLWFSLQSHYRVTDEAFIAETSKYGPSTLLRMCSLLLKERTFVFTVTAAGVVQCGGRKTSPSTSTPFWYISVFESTAHLKFTKLQQVSSGFRCKVITRSLTRLY